MRTTIDGCVVGEGDELSDRLLRDLGALRTEGNGRPEEPEDPDDAVSLGELQPDDGSSSKARIMRTRSAGSSDTKGPLA